MRRKPLKKTILLIVALMLGGVLTANAERIEGTITNADGNGIGGVTVVISETGAVQVTNNDGRYSFEDVADGSYTVTFSLGDNADSEKVDVTGATTIDKSVDWDLSFAETITIFSASRNRERIVDAPAAVTVITEQQLEREATHGQLPKLLEHTPGAEVTQNGLYDFNFNTRGFNSSLNRRVLTLLDGRNASLTFLSSQEWYSLTLPLDQMASVELVRGPGSALYGADAYNGVINMTTRSPRDAAGGALKFSGGDLSTVRGDANIAGNLGGDWHGRLTVGFLESDDFTRSRVDLNGNGILDAPSEAEYPGLSPEVIPLVQDQNKFTWGNARVDGFFQNGHTLSLEYGISDGEGGGASTTGIGRVQIVDIQRPYLRVNYAGKHFNILAYRNERDNETRSLSSGAQLFLESDRDYIEFQLNGGFADGKGRLVGGASYQEETFDSANPAGAQTLVFEPVEEDYSGVFGQVEYNFSDTVKGVFAARYDDASVHDGQFSPRAALVWSVKPNHTLRFNYGEAFQRGNYSEFYLQAGVAPPLTALAAIEAGFCAPFGVDCGFDSVPVLATGNNFLEIEEVQTWEIGYSGILGGKTFLSIDFYNSKLENFLTDLIGSINPTLGPINPGFGPYQVPEGIPGPVAQLLQQTLQGALGPSYFILTNNPVDGTAFLNAVSYTNFGEVDTQGVEVGLNTNLSDEWLLSFNYSWFDFDINEQLAEDPLSANAPEHQFGTSLTYLAPKWDAGLKFRHVDGYLWAAGAFRGDVPSYDLVDFTASYRFNDSLEVGINASNVLDENHWQVFGGDIIERRILGHIKYRW